MPFVCAQVAPRFAAFGDAAPKETLARLQRCASDLQSGAVKHGTPEFDRCTTQSLPPAFSRLSARLARLNADPARLLTQASALANASSRSPREIINPHRRYGDMPLIVLTSGRHPMPPAIPAVVRHQATLYFQALASGHVALAKLSTRGQNQLVPDSGHFIQFDNPSVVLAMVNRVLEEIRPQPTKAAVDPLFRNASVCCSSRRQAERLPSPSAIRFITLGLTQA